MNINKKILKEISSCENIRDLVILLENLIKTKRLSRNLTIMIMLKSQTLKLKNIKKGVSNNE